MTSDSKDTDLPDGGARCEADGELVALYRGYQSRAATLDLLGQRLRDLEKENRRLREALAQWEKYAAYIQERQVVAPLWDNLLFDAARAKTHKALGQ
jgi:hypothetical protein